MPQKFYAYSLPGRPPEEHLRNVSKMAKSPSYRF